MASACAPCVFGASSELLSLRNSIITVPVATSTIIATGLNGSLSTRYETFTFSGTPLPSGVQYVTDTTDITTHTLGTTLTYGTTYVHYLGFYGAAVTAPASTTCAQSLQPTPLTTTNVDPASFVFVYESSTGLPPQLLSYLDNSNGFVEQLNGDQLDECSFLQGSVSVSGLPATVPASATSAVSSSSTTGSSASTSHTPEVIATLTSAQTIYTPAVPTPSNGPVISYSPVVLLQPVSVRAVGVETSSATSIPEPQAVTLPDTLSSTSTPVTLPNTLSSTSTPVTSADFDNLFSILEGATSPYGSPSSTITALSSPSQTPVYPFPVGTITTSPTTNATNATSTQSFVYYTGGSPRGISRVAGMGVVEWLLGLTIPLLL